MKYFLAIVPTVSLLLLGAGCAPTAAKNEVSLEQKMTCQKYQNEIEERLKKDWNDDTQFAQLDEMFYSPQRDSCMFTAETSSMINGVIRESHFLIDTLTNEKIETSNGCLPESECSQSLLQSESEFREKVSVYK